MGRLRRENRSVLEHAVSRSATVERRSSGRVPSQLLHGLPRILAGGHDAGSHVGPAATSTGRARGCSEERDSSHLDSCGRGRRRHGGGTDRAVARGRDVWNLVFGRKTGARERPWPATRDQLQTARLRRDGEEPDSRRRRRRGLRNAGRRAYREEPAVRARLWTRHSIWHGDGEGTADRFAGDVCKVGQRARVVAVLFGTETGGHGTGVAAAF